jgi:hypothetical protein
VQQVTNYNHPRHRHHHHHHHPPPPPPPLPHHHHQQQQQQRIKLLGATADLTPVHLDGYEFEPEDKAEALQSLFEFGLAGNLHFAIIDGA